MKIRSGDQILNVNTMSNWPLLVDLFIKWGHEEEALEEAKNDLDVCISVLDIDDVANELSVWGIPWKKEY